MTASSTAGCGYQGEEFSPEEEVQPVSRGRLPPRGIRPVRRGGTPWGAYFVT
jgi:hypothetical protein